MPERASTLDLVLLGKIWSLAIGGVGGEATAAREQARRLVERHGKTLADVPGLLDAAKAAAPPASGGFKFYDTTNPDHMREWAAADRARRTARAAKEAPEREAIIGRYGSKEAVLAWTAQEQALRAAVAAWSVRCAPPHERFIESIDGLNELSELTGRVRDALSAAIPMPTTIRAALVEYEAWETRDHDLGLVLEDTFETQLDLPARFRRNIVRDLLETGLRAASLEDVLARQRYVVASDMAQPDVEKAVLLDLEHLSALAAQAGAYSGQDLESVQTGQAQGNTGNPVGVGDQEWSTATARRERVRAMLSNVDTRGLSDREIARQVGVSPQTVGNIRRRMSTGKRGGGMFAA